MRNTGFTGRAAEGLNRRWDIPLFRFTASCKTRHRGRRALLPDPPLDGRGWFSGRRYPAGRAAWQRQLRICEHSNGVV